MTKINFIKPFVLLASVTILAFTSCKKEEVKPAAASTPAPAVDTDFQFSATLNGVTYSFKNKTFDEQGLLENKNLGALTKTFQDTTAMLLVGTNSSKDDTLSVYFQDKSGNSKSSFLVGNIDFPIVDLSGDEPTKYVFMKSSKTGNIYGCFQTGDNMTLSITQSDPFSATSILKGTFNGKVFSVSDQKSYSVNGSFRAKKIKD